MEQYTCIGKIHLNPSAIEQLAGVSVSYASIKSTLKVKMTLQEKRKKCLCIKDGLFLILKIVLSTETVICCYGWQ